MLDINSLGASEAWWFCIIDTVDSVETTHLIDDKVEFIFMYFDLLKANPKLLFTDSDLLSA